LFFPSVSKTTFLFSISTTHDTKNKTPHWILLIAQNLKSRHFKTHGIL